MAWEQHESKSWEIAETSDIQKATTHWWRDSWKWHI